MVYLDADVPPCPAGSTRCSSTSTIPRGGGGPRIVAAEPGASGARLRDRALGTDRRQPARVRPCTRALRSQRGARRAPRPLPAAGGRAGPSTSACTWPRIGLVLAQLTPRRPRGYEPRPRRPPAPQRPDDRAVPPCLLRAGGAPLAGQHGPGGGPGGGLAVVCRGSSGVRATPAGLVIAAGAAAGPGGARGAHRRRSRRRAAHRAVPAPRSVSSPRRCCARTAAHRAVLLATASSDSRVARGLRRRISAAAVADGLWHWWTVREPGRLPADEPLGHLVLRRSTRPPRRRRVAFGLGRALVVAPRPEVRR